MYARECQVPGELFAGAFLYVVALVVEVARGQSEVYQFNVVSTVRRIRRADEYVVQFEIVVCEAEIV